SESSPVHRNERQKQRMLRESSKWGEMVEHVEAGLDGVSAIHVMDREADIYELLSDMVGHRRRFVIRAGQDRLLVGDDEKLLQSLADAPVLLDREVDLSARPQQRTTCKGRSYPARPAR